jgi:hypothetical protein
MDISGRHHRPFTVINSAADPGCSFRILIFLLPGSRILDPISGIQHNTKEEGKKVLAYHFLAKNLTKL